MASGDLSRIHPEMVRRYDALRRLVELEGGRLWYASTWRPKEPEPGGPTSQREFWNRYQAGTGNLAANPDRVLGRSPWGWPLRGSWHMVQEDGWAHAMDFSWSKITTSRLEALARKVGLRRTVPSENWHYQWISIAYGIFPIEEPGLIPPLTPPPVVIDPIPPLYPVPPQPRKRKMFQFGDGTGAVYLYDGVRIVPLGGLPNVHEALLAVAPFIGHLPKDQADEFRKRMG